MVREIPAFKTNVVTGPALLVLSENVRGWQKRDCYRQLTAYLHSAECDRVCLLFDLRRTGKTTLLRQAVRNMIPEDAAKTAYVKATKQDTIADLNRDMEQLRSLGFWFTFLQELYNQANTSCTLGSPRILLMESHIAMRRIPN